MDGKTGSTIMGDGIKDKPGEGVVAFQHVSETGHKVTSNAFCTWAWEYFKMEDPY